MTSQSDGGAGASECQECGQPSAPGDALCDDCLDGLECTWCGGEGVQENDDPLWYGDAPEVPCVCCNGTGLRKHQTIF